MSKTQPRECLHCKALFTPDYRNRWHQKFCPEPACRQASKAQSQRRWLQKPANQQYFRDRENVRRVQAWRKAHPEYWKRTKKAPSALQEICSSQPVDNQCLSPKTSAPPLQDVCSRPLARQDPLLVGLISQLIDSPLQEHIEQATRRLIVKGRGILGLMPGVTAPENYENQKTSPLSPAVAPHSRPVQLDRSTTGP